MRKIRKIVLPILLTMVLAAPVFAEIRGLEWGMSKAQVKEAEGKPEAEEEDRLVYKDQIAGLETEVVFLFNHREELFSIEYRFLMERFLMMPALSQYERINRILREHYGPPDSGDINLDRDKKLGMLALEKPITARWDKDRVTNISHSLDEKMIHQHILIYSHQALRDEFKAFLKQKEKEKF